MRQRSTNEGKSQSRPQASPWSVPVVVSEIPETGRHLDLVADDATRAAIAQAAGVASVQRFVASVELSRHGRDGVHAVGQVSATVGQACVVTLEPLQNQVEEQFDLVFAPAPDGEAGAQTRRVRAQAAAEGSAFMSADDPPEVLQDGIVDVGALVTEFLILGIDPYPRKPGAQFDSAPAGDPGPHPFAALAALKKDMGPKSR